MAAEQPYDREAQDVRDMYAAAERLRELDQVPPPLQSAVAHTLYAAANELDHGRPLPREVRRAARHVVSAVSEVEAGLS